MTDAAVVRLLEASDEQHASSCRSRSAPAARSTAALDREAMSIDGRDRSSARMTDCSLKDRAWHARYTLVDGRRSDRDSPRSARRRRLRSTSRGFDVGPELPTSQARRADRTWQLARLAAVLEVEARSHRRSAGRCAHQGAAIAGRTDDAAHSCPSARTRLTHLMARAPRAQNRRRR